MKGCWYNAALSGSREKDTFSVGLEGETAAEAYNTTEAGAVQVTQERISEGSRQEINP